MRVKMHLVCPEFFKSIPNGLYEFPDGSSVMECVERCAAGCEVTLRDGWSDKVLFMKDNKPVQKDDQAFDGSEICVVRMVYGG